MIEFFRKYSAVPANDAGPQWSKATDAALCSHFNAIFSIAASGWNRAANREATNAERQAVLPEYQEICAEIHRRAKLPDPAPEILAICLTRLA